MERLSIPFHRGKEKIDLLLRIQLDGTFYSPPLLIPTIYPIISPHINATNK